SIPAKPPRETPRVRIWHFAGCVFDEVRYELRVHGTVAELEVKPLEVLHQLLLHAGDVVRKEDLLESVWPGVLVVDASLATAVSKLRKALADGDAIIKTVPKIGYRLSVPVRCEFGPEPEVQSNAVIELPRVVPEPVTPSLSATLRRHIKVSLITVAALVAVIVGLAAFRRPYGPTTGPSAVAILPFQNLSSNHDVDYLRSALPDEIANTLSSARSLELRPLTSSNRYTNPTIDLREVGRDLNVNRVITGNYLLAGDQLQITMEAVDPNEDRVLWHDTVNIPANNLLALQSQIAATARNKMSRALGVTDFVSDSTPPPRNAQAYELYLRSTALDWDAASNRQGVDLLRRSVGLDPNYGPAWGLLSLRYYNEARFDGGGRDILDLSDAAAQKQLALEPDSPDPVAELTIHQTERGDLVRAHSQAIELVRRRPDVPNNHHVLSYVLRYGGSIEEAGHQCDMVEMLAYKFVWGSCLTTWMELGNFEKARKYLRKDLSTGWSRAHAIEIYLREGRIADAVKVPSPEVPGWQQSYKMVQACAANAPQAEIKTLAAEVHPDDDPEVTYFFAGHLAYCGQTDAALRMLNASIDGNHCSYPTMDRDPMFDKIRNTPGFAKVRTAAIACHDDFVNDRERMARQ
ncbi:MAG TPA: winged helix-turn-helix domain-containing protein, partial [Terriglobales bacterium]|nr:winged helix-turn-helix domain-containing protein [Terriglobales bacterium]